MRVFIGRVSIRPDDRLTVRRGEVGSDGRTSERKHCKKASNGWSATAATCPETSSTSATFRSTASWSYDPSLVIRRQDTMSARPNSRNPYDLYFADLTTRENPKLTIDRGELPGGGETVGGDAICPRRLLHAHLKESTRALAAARSPNQHASARRNCRSASSCIDLMRCSSTPSDRPISRIVMPSQ
jgi:hypothetical protein